MREKLKIYFLFFILLLCSFINTANAEDGKIYLDITQPGIKKLTLAIEGFDNLPLVWNTIKQNLEFTEYFRVYGPFPYKGEKFEPSLWKGSDVEIVVKAETVNKISMKLFTVTSDVPVFTKDYSLQNNEHTGNLIAADIYRILTGKEPPFLNRIAFVRKIKGSMGIFISNWNGKKIHDTGIRREIISKVILKGNSIFYSSIQGKFWHIELFDLSTKKNKEIIKTKKLLQIGDTVNNSRFVYIENDGELSEIKLSDISGNSKIISSSHWIDASPRWAGSHIFFVSNRSGSPQIYQMSQSGNGIRRVTYQGRYNTEPTISPDGSKLAFSSLTGGFQIFIIDTLSGAKVQLTKDGNNEQPSFCPDGHFLTIMSDKRGKKEIYLISSDGTIQKSLTDGYLPYCTR